MPDNHQQENVARVKMQQRFGTVAAIGGHAGSAP